MTVQLTQLWLTIYYHTHTKHKTQNIKHKAPRKEYLTTRLIAQPTLLARDSHVHVEHWPSQVTSFPQAQGKAQAILQGSLQGNSQAIQEAVRVSA